MCRQEGSEFSFEMDGANHMCLPLTPPPSPVPPHQLSIHSAVTNTDVHSFGVSVDRERGQKGQERQSVSDRGSSLAVVLFFLGFVTFVPEKQRQFETKGVFRQHY